MPQEQSADDRDDYEFGDEFAGQIVDRGVDELRSIIGRDNLDPFGKTGLEYFQPLFNCCDGSACILALPEDDDAACDLAFTVEFGNAAPHFWAKLDRGDIG